MATIIRVEGTKVTFFNPPGRLRWLTDELRSRRRHGSFTKHRTERTLRREIAIERETRSAPRRSPASGRPAASRSSRRARTAESGRDGPGEPGPSCPAPVLGVGR